MDLRCGRSCLCLTRSYRNCDLRIGGNRLFRHPVGTPRCVTNAGVLRPWVLRNRLIGMWPWGLMRRTMHSKNPLYQEQSKSHSSRRFLFACTAGGIAGDKPASTFEYVQFGTDADVPKGVQCGKPINAIGECGSLPYPGLWSDDVLKVNDGETNMFHLIWYIVIGLISGVIAKSVMHVHMTIFWTIVLGIIGSILGGAATHLLWRPTNARYHPAGLIFSTLGAILVLFVCYKLNIHFPATTLAFR
jgi:uncharacterized membrane protein YeaQ/YmgE (transglycosylase-associated protein family)